MAVLLSAKTCSLAISKATEKVLKPAHNYKTQPRCDVVLHSREAPSSRRNTLASGAASIIAVIAINYGLTPSLAWAEEKTSGQEEEDNTGVVGAIKSLFDPNERTKSGKVLPKAYLKSARDVVKNLRESLKEDPKDIAKFRRTADAAKESIRDYLGNWRGKQAVAQEESYAAIEKAIKSLASFYSKAGPSAPMPEGVKSDILRDLDTAEEFL